MFVAIDPNALSGRKVGTAAPDDLFKVDGELKMISQDKQEEFHSVVAKTLFVTKRARPDTCTAIAFLTTRVERATADDWRKLNHLVKYLMRQKNYH